jgi:hypothetical protein
MMMRKLAIAFVVLLVGCGMQNTKVGDGRAWIEVTCSGFADWTTCNKKAEKYCPNGYDVSAREESVIAQRRAMMISCKK